MKTKFLFIYALIHGFLTVWSAGAQVVQIKKGQWQLFVIQDSTFKPPFPISDSVYMTQPDTVYVLKYVVYHDTIYLKPSIPLVSVITTQTLPTGAPKNDNQPTAGTGIEFGTKFKSSLSGFIHGIRFYKLHGTTGTHTAELYQINGNKLYSVPFTSETDSGWQTVSFLTPIPVTHDSIYVASVFSSSGQYSSNISYLTNGVSNQNLSFIANLYNNQYNGVWGYGNSPLFPTNHNSATYFWTDIIFSTQ